MSVLAAGSLKFTFRSDGALEVRLEGGRGALDLMLVSEWQAFCSGDVALMNASCALSAMAQTRPRRLTVSWSRDQTRYCDDLSQHTFGGRRLGRK